MHRASTKRLDGGGRWETSVLRRSGRSSSAERGGDLRNGTSRKLGCPRARLEITRKRDGWETAFARCQRKKSPCSIR